MTKNAERQNGNFIMWTEDKRWGKTSNIVFYTAWSKHIPPTPCDVLELFFNRPDHYW